MIFLAFPTLVAEMYTALVGQLTALATFLDAIPSSPAFTDKLRQLSEWFLVLTTRFHEIKSSPVVTEVVQKTISGITFGRDLWTRLIDGYPSVKSAVELLTNFASAVFQAATKYFYNTVRNAFDHPVLQKIIHHRRLSGLSNHPVVQSLLEHPTFQNYPVKSVNHQHAAAINSFLGGVSVFAHDAHHDAEKVTMTLITPKSRIQKLRNDINAIDGDAKIDDNFYWVCVSVMTMITITILSCLAVVLATKSSKHRSAIHAIAAVIIGIVAYFIHCFSPVLRSLDEDVHAFFKLIFMYTYMPLLALCALIYFWSWGKSDSDLAKQRERDTNKTVLVLQRQLSETAKNSTVSLEDSADMKLKLSGLNDALEAALKSKEEAVKELHAEKKRSADAPKTIIMQMEDDEDTMVMPTASSKASQSRSIVSDRKVDIKADVLAITAEKDTATAALSDSVRQIQDLTTQVEASKVEWKGEKADVLAITAEKDTATAALSDSVRQIQDLTAQLGVSKVEWEGEKEALSAKVVTLTEQCKAYEEAKVDQVKQAQTKQSQSDKLTAGLQKQLSDLQTAQTTAVTDAAAAHTSIKESLEVAVKARADQKTKIKALRADIEIAIKSKDEALTQLQAEQTKVLAITAEKDTATAALSDSVEKVQDLTTQLEVSKVQCEGEKAYVLAITAEKDTATAALSDSLRQIQDLTTQLEASKVQCEGEKAYVLAITAEKDTATAALSDSVRQIQDLTTQLEASKVQCEGEKADVLAITAEKDTATAALSDSVRQIQDLTTQVEVSKVQCEGEKAYVLAITAEKDRATAALSDSLRQIQDLTTQVEASKVECEGEKAYVLAITAEKDRATAALSDSLRQIHDLTTQLEASKVEWEGEREVLGAKVATLTEQCKAVQAEKVEVEKSLQSTHTAAIEELRKQVVEMEAHTVQVSDNLKESESRVSLTRQDSKKFEADMKTKLGASANDLIAAQKSQENTLQELHLEQKKSAVLETEKCTLENKISALTAECTAARQACDEARVQVQEGEEKLKLAVSSGAAGESSLHALSALMDETNQKLSAVKEELTASAARETSLIAELSVTTEKRQTDVDRLQQQLRVAEDTVVKLMEECRVAHDTVEESNRQIKALEGVCANNLIASQTALSSSHSEKNDVINEKALLSEQYNTLRKELDMATAASLAAQNVHTITVGDLQAKLAGSQDSLRLALLDCSSAREEIKVITEEHQKQLAEKGVEMSAMQAKLRDVEATRAVALREQEEVRARLSAQLAKHAADQASSEEELREMEGQLKSFVDVCNSTRLVLVGAQEDLRVSEQRRKEDADSFLVKLKESGQANSVLAGRTEEDRAKLVALEMQAIAVASSGETGLDNVQQQLEISEAERRRVSVSADEMKAGLIIARQEIAELQAKRDTDLSVLQSKVEELQREKQSSINANDALTVRLTSALEVISFFEKEREEDIMSMQRELKESAKARKKIIADFDVARGDLAAAEVTLRNSLPVSPSRSNGSRSPVTPPPHTPEAKSPVLPLIEAAIMKQMVNDLTMARDSAESECALLQSKLDNAIFDYEELKAMRSIEIQQMEDALEALECLESERNALHSECEKLTLLLGMPVQRSTAAANTGVSVGAGVSTGMSGYANTGAGAGATVAASGSEGVSLSAGVSRTADEDTDMTDSVAAAEVEDKVLSPVLPTPARPASLNLRGRSSTKEAPVLTRSTSQKGVRPGHGSSMATTSNPMLGPSNPMRMRPASASSLLPTDLNAPKPLIMTSSRLWANAKTVALMTVRGKRASNATSTPLSPLSDINSPEVKSTDQLNESVKAELENLRKVKQTLGTNLLSATEAISAAVNSISTPEWASSATKSAVRDLKMQYDQNDVDATQSLSQKSNNREEEDDDWVLRSALQKPRLPVSPQDAKTPNNEPVDEDSTEICSFTSPFSTHHSPSTSPCPVDTKTSRKFDRASGSILAVDNPVSESKGGGEGGVVVGESEGYTFRSVTVIGDGVSILNKNENGDGTEYDDDDSPMTVPSGDGSKNPFGFPLGDGTDPANSELKENCEDSGEPTPEEGGSPLSQTSTVRSYGSGSERLPLPQAIGGKAALRKSETAKPRFVTTGGVVDPIPPSRLSIATKTTK